MTFPDNALESFLQKNFGHQSFREGQKEIITDVLNQNSVLGVLPTGTGKSICFQLPAIINHGLTIVISPLISLMIDQVNQLKAKGFRQVACLNSFMGYEEREFILQNIEKFKLLYISPELLQTEFLQNKIKHLQIDLFVVDEAHCISQWGHEFRPDYLSLGYLREILGNPPVLALSATATKEVRKDIAQVLNTKSIKEHIYPMDRENIIHLVQHLENGEETKIQALKAIISQIRVPTVVYFSNRNLLESVANQLKYLFPDRNISYYHGEMDSMDRMITQQQFINNELDLICCTSAFGMGIDKENIRLVIHYHFPKDMESFIQEFGRAGRDGKRSLSVVLSSNDDIERSLHLIEHDLPAENHLRGIFAILKQMSESNKSIPSKMEEIETLFQLTEVQWRFLFYQFKKHGMIKKMRINFNQELWNRTFLSIKRYIEERREIKKEKLLQMINWLYEEDCLRSAIYKNFDSSFKEVYDFCCGNCGFELDEFISQQLSSKKSRVVSWEEKLQEKLLINHGQ